MFDILASLFGQILPTNTSMTPPPTGPHPDNTLFSTDPDGGASWQAAAGQPRDWVPWEATEEDLGGFGNFERVAALQAPGVLGERPTPPLPSPYYGTATPPGIGTPDPRDTGANLDSVQQGAQRRSSTVKPTSDQLSAIDEVYRTKVVQHVKESQAPKLSPALTEAPPLAGPEALDEVYDKEITRDPQLISGPTEVTRRGPQLVSGPTEVTRRGSTKELPPPPMKLGRPPSKLSITNGTLKAPGLKIRAMYKPTAPYMSRSRNLSRVNQIILHGTRDGPTENFVKYGQRVDTARGFDPGYHFYVGRDGEIIQGAPLDKVVYGARGRNSNTVHISFIGGDGQNGVPNRIQTIRGIQLASAVGKALGISSKHVWGHGEIQANRDENEAGNIASILRKKGWVD